MINNIIPINSKVQLSLAMHRLIKESENQAQSTRKYKESTQQLRNEIQLLEKKFKDYQSSLKSLDKKVKGLGCRSYRLMSLMDRQPIA
ncbi:MAG: hypothetical protein OQK35_00315 [Alphaproteobacteria bacterium]|nr:hypothetical protein [Alphaproteobacteria bacterium]